jgi:hypothetical protein
MTSPGPIVVFSYHFAPEVLVGGKRWSFLSREFRARGRKVHVFTRQMSPTEERDDSLPIAASVTRLTPAFEPFVRGTGVVARVVNRIAYSALEPVGLEIGWARSALHAARREIPREPMGVVVGTLPPPSAALAAAAFAKERRWPLVLDYRDPWSGYHWTRKLRGRYARTAALFFEGRCVTASAARIFTTPEMQREFVKWFPRCPTEGHFVIPNGFDPDEPSHVEGTAVPGRDIVYAGEFYGERSLMLVLRALARARASNTSLSNVRLVVYGVVREGELQAAAREGLDTLIDVRPRVPRSELLKVLRQAATLLVMPSFEMNYSMPYKLYDYLGARRPILAVAPRGSALERFVRQYRVGTLADAASEQSIEQAIRDVLTLNVVPDASAAIEAHRWGKLAEDYLRAIDSVA